MKNYLGMTFAGHRRRSECWNHVRRSFIEDATLLTLKGGERIFKKILYPTDFSDVSKKALGYIKQLKDSGVKEVIVLHVIDRRADDAVHRYLDDQKFQELKRRKLEETKESLGGIEKELKQVGLKIKSRIEVGIPVRDILRVEEDEKVSAVVIGSHGISNLAEIFLGSVSEKVIRRCKTPVLVIKR